MRLQQVAAPSRGIAQPEAQVQQTRPAPRNATTSRGPIVHQEKAVPRVPARPSVRVVAPIRSALVKQERPASHPPAQPAARVAAATSQVRVKHEETQIHLPTQPPPPVKREVTHSQVRRGPVQPRRPMIIFGNRGEHAKKIFYLPTSTGHEIDGGVETLLRTKEAEIAARRQVAATKERSRSDNVKRSVETSASSQTSGVRGTTKGLMAPRRLETIRAAATAERADERTSRDPAHGYRKAEPPRVPDRTSRVSTSAPLHHHYHIKARQNEAVTRRERRNAAIDELLDDSCHTLAPEVNTLWDSRGRQQRSERRFSILSIIKGEEDVTSKQEHGEDSREKSRIRRKGRKADAFELPHAHQEGEEIVVDARPYEESTDSDRKEAQVEIHSSFGQYLHTLRCIISQLKARLLPIVQPVQSSQQDVDEQVVQKMRKFWEMLYEFARIWSRGTDLYPEFRRFKDVCKDYCQGRVALAGTSEKICDIFQEGVEKVDVGMYVVECFAAKEAKEAKAAAQEKELAKSHQRSRRVPRTEDDRGEGPR